VTPITLTKKLFYIYKPAPSWDGVPIQKDGGGYSLQMILAVIEFAYGSYLIMP